jgi:D-erythro-7,8-dihydroneopterin triphosphate epimerase
MGKLFTAKIKSLRLRTLIGIYPHEKEHRQDVILHVSFSLDAKTAVETDRVEDTVDYKTLTKKIIQKVENSQFDLLESLTHQVLEIVRADPRVQWAEVEVEKPHALRYADSVSFTASWERPE